MSTGNALQSKIMLKERYQIREVLGENGLSITYKAFQKLLLFKVQCHLV